MTTADATATAEATVTSDATATTEATAAEAAATDPHTVVVRYVEAVRDGDAATIAASFAEDATWHYPGSLPISRIWQGRDAIINDFLGGMGAYLDTTAPVVIELVNSFASGNQVLAEWTSKATAADGTPYDNRCAAVFTVHNGEITSVVEYADTHHVAASLFGEK